MLIIRRHLPIAMLVLLLVSTSAALTESKPPVEVKLGTEGQLIINGTPTILLGVWQQPMNLFEYHASQGINTLVIPPGGRWQRPNYEPYVTKAASLGLNVIMSGFDEKLRHHPNILAWTVGLIEHNGGAHIIANSRRTRRADPNRLIMVNVKAADMIQNKQDDDVIRRTLAEVDCVVSHVWPEMFDNQPRNLRLVGDFVTRIRELSADRPAGQLSIWPDINPHAWRDSQRRDFAEPTPTELRFQVWLALISGADGICFFTISFDPFVYLQVPSRNENEIAWNTRLIKRMTPVLTAGPSPLKITATADEQEAIIDLTTRRHEGADYVFLLNGQDREQNLTLKLEGLGERYRMESVLADQPAAISLPTPGRHQEKLPGLALRIWRIVPLENDAR